MFASGMRAVGRVTESRFGVVLVIPKVAGLWLVSPAQSDTVPRKAWESLAVLFVDVLGFLVDAELAARVVKGKEWRIWK